MHFYLENLKEPSVRFKVMSYDKDTKIAKLKGEYGAEFSRDISKEALKQFGYKMVKSEVELPLMSAPKPKALKPKKVKKVVEEEEDEDDA